MKWNRNEMRKNRCAGIRQACPVESFVGRCRIATGFNVENPSLNLTFGCRAGKTEYESIQDSRQVPRPI